jgi:hypothetical protein
VAATICLAVIALAIRHAKDLVSCVLSVTAVYSRSRKRRKRARRILRILQATDPQGRPQRRRTDGPALAVPDHRQASPGTARSGYLATSVARALWLYTFAPLYLSR